MRRLLCWLLGHEWSRFAEWRWVSTRHHLLRRHGVGKRCERCGAWREDSPRKKKAGGV